MEYLEKLKNIENNESLLDLDLFCENQACPDSKHTHLDVYGSITKNHNDPIIKELLKLIALHYIETRKKSKIRLNIF